MKKTFCLSCILLFVFLSGCANDDYVIEKEFYYLIQRDAAKIFKSPDSAPPNELNRVVTRLRNFADKYPKKIFGLEAEFNIARLYMVKREYEKSREQMRAMLEKYSASDAVSSETIFLIGNSYEIEDKWTYALREYQRLIKDYPTTLRGLSVPIYIAQHYKIKYEPDKMIAAYQEAALHYRYLAEKYPNSPLGLNAYLLISECYLALKDWKNAINTLDTISEKYKGRISVDEVMFNKAMVYIKGPKENAKAAEILNSLIAQYPKSRYVKVSRDLIKRLSAKK